MIMFAAGKSGGGKGGSKGGKGSSGPPQFPQNKPSTTGKKSGGNRTNASPGGDGK